MNLLFLFLLLEYVLMEMEISSVTVVKQWMPFDQKWNDDVLVDQVYHYYLNWFVKIKLLHQDLNYDVFQMKE